MKDDLHLDLYGYLDMRRGRNTQHGERGAKGEFEDDYESNIETSTRHIEDAYDIVIAHTKTTTYSNSTLAYMIIYSIACAAAFWSRLSPHDGTFQFSVICEFMRAAFCWI